MAAFLDMFNASIRNQDILRILRLLAIQWKKPLTNKICANVIKHRIQYLEIEQDNHNLIWFYTLMLQDGIELPRGEVIAAMKKRLLDEDVLTPMAWRYVANGTVNDFRLIIDAEDPGDTPYWRWKSLVYWLQILSGLRRISPISEPIQNLFMHDSLLVMPKLGEIQFRGVWMSLGALRHIIEVAEYRLAAGSLDKFIEVDLVEVLTWIATNDSDLDHNQTKSGWKYLARKSAEWRTYIATEKTYQNLRWTSALPRMQINEWIIEPLVDAWSLHKLAMSQRHCGDRFIEDCINGSERIFVIRKPVGNISATLRLTCADGKWMVGDIKGFANSKITAELSDLGEIVAQKYSCA